MHVSKTLDKQQDHSEILVITIKNFHDIGYPYLLGLENYVQYLEQSHFLLRFHVLAHARC